MSWMLLFLDWTLLLVELKPPFRTVPSQGLRRWLEGRGFRGVEGASKGREGGEQGGRVKD